MIARISGTLICKNVTHVVVDAHGIGYRVFVPLTTFYELPDIGQPVDLNIHTHVKQDSINLFGFYTNEERDVFQLMISVTGIGPKLALNILFRYFCQRVDQGCFSWKSEPPGEYTGVGKKMAQRLVIELRDKVLKLTSDEVVGEPGGKMTADELMKEDIMSALINLGYKSHNVREILDRVFNESKEVLTLDVLLKKTLKILAS